MAEQKGYEGPVPNDEKLCSMLFTPGGTDWKVMKILVKDPKYICRECARAAANASHLCSPETL